VLPEPVNQFYVLIGGVPSEAQVPGVTRALLIKIHSPTAPYNVAYPG